MKIFMEAFHCAGIGTGLDMFNVSEQQYDELTKAYFEAERLSEENLKKVSYTYFKEKICTVIFLDALKLPWNNGTHQRV